VSHNPQTTFPSSTGGAPRRSAGFSFWLRLLLLGIALLALTGTVAEMIVHAALQQNTNGQPINDPGYQHAQRLQVSTARAAMDALGMAGTDPAPYRFDYRVQRMQMQADTEGLDRWAAHDPRHQGLLKEIRASLADLRLALDQTAGASAAPGTPRVPLLTAMNRTQRALSNYAANLTAPASSAPGFFSSPGQTLLLILVEIILVVWLFIWVKRA
jgi:hypothetical protein